MSNQINSTLGNLVKEGGGIIHTGPFGSQLHAEDYVAQGIPCIMPANMKDNRVDLSNIAYISEADAQRLSKYLVKEGDIVYSRRGNVTLKALIRKNEVGYFCGTGCLLLRPGNLLDSDYLTYYLSTPKIQSWIISQAIGATMPNLNTGILSRIPFSGPEKSVQEKISSTLRAIDDKLEINNRINAELEAMAKALYDYWFVQFDFPDANGKPYKTSGGKMEYNATLKREIPAGWNLKPIVECCDVIDCLHSKKPVLNYTSDEYYLLQLENIEDNGLLDMSMKYFVSHDDYINWTSRIEVKQHDIVMTNAGRIAAFAQIPEGIKCGIGRNITAIRPKNIKKNYFFSALSGMDIQSQIARNLDHGAFFKSFNVKGIKLLKIIKTDNGLEDKFESLITPVIEKRQRVQHENQMLKELRDWLLPLLMNGQVTVK
ncbi:restriction endonuclease subunit S [Enterobacter sp. RHBSTW-00994]|uniref:restriction endonuclease subunit S n=1 Tax=Enterobacter sp. RHBSTW-00994 TaxID=2742676 RepID=UPI0015EA469D|nr:restriction endonuclease subunit S [Enterobacter sp. RHBSTW-00994]QLR41488.1 restriction endonuclease subunit S [Enterobacter sp. RHBSTW-00994]